MEFFIYYILTVVCCSVLFIFNNYLVKIKKIDYQWKITADIFWWFTLTPVVNIITSIFVLCVLSIVVYNLTKNFIEQN